MYASLKTDGFMKHSQRPKPKAKAKGQEPKAKSQMLFFPLTFSVRILKCLKHLYSEMFETFSESYGTAVYIGGGGQAYRHHSAPAPVVGRARHCGPAT